MALERALEHLRARSKEDRTAFAGGIAISIAAILFLGWVTLFINRVHSTNAALPAHTVVQNANVAAVNGAQ